MFRDRFVPCFISSCWNWSVRISSRNMFVLCRICGLNGRALSRGKEMLNHVLNQWIESISFESALYDIKEKIGV